MEFVATVSHELRTPLAVIRSAAQNLAAGVVHDTTQAQRYGDLIESEGRRLTDMVEQVLEFAGLKDVKRRVIPRPMDAVPVLHDVIASTSSLPEARGVEIDLKIGADVPVVMADEAAFRRALNNLIGNALKYAGDGRWIGVSAARGAGPDDGFVLVSVADRGNGIASDDLAHIFEPFYRGRHAVEQQIRGNGLGLSLVKQLLQAIGGRVSVTSAPGQGSQFTLHLPVATDVSPNPA
jgi:signal transduction histidine kinase